MTKKIAAFCAVVIAISGVFVYDEYVRGIIAPEEIYVDVLGRDQESVFAKLGRPRDSEEWSERVRWAFWQGRESGGWLYEAWFVDGNLAHIRIAYDLYPDIERLKSSIGTTDDWHLGTVTGLEEREHEAWLTADRSIAIFETGSSVDVANGNSFMWE